MGKLLRSIFLVDLFQGLWVTFRNQHPKYIYTEQYPQERPKVAERYRGAPRLNINPDNLSLIHILRVILKLDGEKVLGADCVIGYLHRGVEKIAENRTFAQFNPYVDRMDYVAAISNGLGYCLAVEKVLNVEAPPRAQTVRVILTELNRIASHLLWLCLLYTSRCV